MAYLVGDALGEITGGPLTNVRPPQPTSPKPDAIPAPTPEQVGPSTQTSKDDAPPTDDDCTPNRTPRPKSSTIRRRWEDHTGQPWPEDPDRPGKPQEAAHRKARADGGTDDPGNIDPKPRKVHRDEHKMNGDFKRWGARGCKDRDGGAAQKPAPADANGDGKVSDEEESEFMKEPE